MPGGLTVKNLYEHRPQARIIISLKLKSLTKRFVCTIVPDADIKGVLWGKY
jgi:hypothetical protein